MRGLEEIMFDSIVNWVTDHLTGKRPVLEPELLQPGVKPLNVDADTVPGAPWCSEHGEAMVLGFFDRPGGPPGNGWVCPSCAKGRFGAAVEPKPASPIKVPDLFALLSAGSKA